MENVGRSVGRSASLSVSTQGCAAAVMQLLVELLMLAPRLQLLVTCESVPVTLAATASVCGADHQWLVMDRVLPLDEEASRKLLCVHAGEELPVVQSHLIIKVGQMDGWSHSGIHMPFVAACEQAIKLACGRYYDT